MAKLSNLRCLLKELKLDGFIVGSGDAHQSEYVPASDKRRAFISEFTGSAGTALILKNQALLWTDGRYFLQGSQELSSEWTLMKSGLPGVLEMDQWVLQNSESLIIGVDPFLMSTKQAQALQRLWSSKNIILKPIDVNPVDTVWNQSGSRPSQSTNPIIVHPLEYAGNPYEDKIKSIQAFVHQNQAHGLLISALDEIAWLLNIRGSDIDFNPVVISYCIITLEKCFFFVYENKITDSVRDHFNETHGLIIVYPYEHICTFLEGVKTARGMVLLDPSIVNWKLSSALGDYAKHIVSPITLPKALKNSIEIEGMRQSHIRDGVALTAFLCWLEGHVRSSETVMMTEYEVTEKIEEFRHKMPLHLYPSFETIAGYGPNGAIIHYKPKEGSSALLGKDALFLLDSGAQYFDGTTDVTRTVCFGDVSDRMKNCYTLVLKGHIGLARAVFPEGTLGSRLDSLARLPLWSNGLDYNHGTGHGVGAFLNVHEGPQSVSFRKRDDEVGFQAGMTISNEPGYYEDGSFGVRIENILVTVDAKTTDRFQGKAYCKFENLTLVPIKTSLINLSLLDENEIEYINSYHALVREKLLELMKQYFPEAVQYLIDETKPIQK